MHRTLSFSYLTDLPGKCWRILFHSYESDVSHEKVVATVVQIHQRLATTAAAVFPVVIPELRFVFLGAVCIHLFFCERTRPFGLSKAFVC